MTTSSLDKTLYKSLNQQSNFAEGTGTKFFTSLSYTDNMQTIDVLLEHDINIDDEYISLNAITEFHLYEGTRIQFNTNDDVFAVYVKEFTPRGSTKIIIEPSLYNIAKNVIGTIFAWIPIVSTNHLEITFNRDPQTLEIISKGVKVHGDPGIKTLQDSVKYNEHITVEIIKSFYQGVFQASVKVKNLTEIIQKGTFIQQEIKVVAPNLGIQFDY